jgi:cytochrome P450 family 33
MLLALVLLLVATLALYNCWWKRRKLPPGPMPFPLFGNMLEVAREPPGYEAFRRWRAKYGPVYTVRNFRKKVIYNSPQVWFGEDPCVVMADYATIRETFLRDGDTFAGRHFLPDRISSVLPGLFYLYIFLMF